MSSSILLRLGLILTGSNEDLLPPEKKNEGDGAGPSSEDEDKKDSDSDDEEDGSGESKEDEEKEEDSKEDESGSGSDEGDNESEEEEEGEEEESDDDGEDSKETTADSDDGADDDEGDSEDDSEDDDKGQDDEDTSAPEGEDEGDSGLGDKDGENKEPSEDGADEGDSKDESGEPQEQDSKEPSKDGSEGEAGGSGYEDDSTGEIAQSLLDAMENGEDSGLLDNNQALKDKVAEEVDGADDLQKDEQVWRPYFPDYDVVTTVKETAASKVIADQLRKKVKAEISFLKNKLRSKFLQARTPQTLHGVRDGRGLSERRLVSSFVDIKVGRRPERPDWMKLEREDCSLAVGIVLDESGSMSRLTAAVGQAAIAIAEPLDILGSPCLVVGPRNFGVGYTDTGDVDPKELLMEGEDGKMVPRFHRTKMVVIDVFKNWNEPFSRCLGRFGRVQAGGSTPLEDGIQYAMQELSERPERHRVILVITDGFPDRSQVVARQIRLAAAAGVHVIGVGISAGCSEVKELFPEHVAVENVKHLPVELLKTLDKIMFPKTGRRVELDGKFKKAK